MLVHFALEIFTRELELCTGLATLKRGIDGSVWNDHDGLYVNQNPNLPHGVRLSMPRGNSFALFLWWTSSYTKHDI